MGLFKVETQQLLGATDGKYPQDDIRPLFGGTHEQLHLALKMEVSTEVTESTLRCR